MLNFNHLCDIIPEINRRDIMFSQRIGLEQVQILQEETMDEKLKNDIWNAITKHFLDLVYDSSWLDKYSLSKLAECVNHPYIIDLYENFFYEKTTNVMNISLQKVKEKISNKFDNFQWYKVYDMIEYVVGVIHNKTAFRKDINNRLERNNSAYRLVKNDIVKIVNPAEINAINNATNTKYKEVNTHIEKAIHIFSNKTKPDYENVIKESITAVEAICSSFVGKTKSLSDALVFLEKKGIKIHPALNEGFKKLYSYTSDAKGVRHAGNLGGKDSTFEEAKFMLIACSAFINYLIDITRDFV